MPVSARAFDRWLLRIIAGVGYCGLFAAAGYLATQAGTKRASPAVLVPQDANAGLEEVCRDLWEIDGQEGAYDPLRLARYTAVHPRLQPLYNDACNFPPGATDTP
jgi:hypothetical protein